MGRKTLSLLYRQFVRIMTFIDLPINRKFTLFSVGVIFWLLALAIVSAVALIRVDLTYSQILYQTIPRERVAKKVASELSMLQMEVLDLRQSEKAKEILSHSDLILSRLTDVQLLTSSLQRTRDLFEDRGEVLRVIGKAFIPSPRDVKNDESYLFKITAVTDALVESVRKTTAEKIVQVQGEGSVHSQEYDLFDADKTLELMRQGERLSRNYAAEMEENYRSTTAKIGETILTSFVVMFGVLSLALILLGIFTRWIAVAISEPIRAMTGQIHSLSTGDIDLSEKIDINSEDEIGTLAAEFNGLMESVYGMTAFKNVIEEDAHLHDIYARLGAVFSDVIGIDGYCIYEIQDNQHDMRAVYPPDLHEDELHCSGMILENCDLCRARKTGHQISSLIYPGVCQQFKPEESHQVHLCVPLNIGGHIGIVVQFIFNPLNGTPFDRVKIQHQVDRATVYLKEAQSVIEAKRLLATLRDSSLKDAMTGLYNRRFLQEHSQQVVAGCHRRGTNIGLLMCDIDFFKQVNDKYGHETGDQLLRETATALSKSLRESDYVIRFGGEEFLVLLIDIDEEEAVNVAEKIRHAVSSVRVQTPTGPLSKTISIGISLFPADGDAFWQSIKFADVALYKAKESGRDRVVRFNPEMWSGDSF